MASGGERLGRTLLSIALVVGGVAAGFGIEHWRSESEHHLTGSELAISGSSVNVYGIADRPLGKTTCEVFATSVIKDEPAFTIGGCSMVAAGPEQPATFAVMEQVVVVGEVKSGGQTCTITGLDQDSRYQLSACVDTGDSMMHELQAFDKALPQLNH